MKKRVQYRIVDIESAVRRLCTKLIQYMQSIKKDEVIFLTLLEGGAFLAGKILQNLPYYELMRLNTYSMKVSSYHGKERGDLNFKYIPDVDFNNKHVIVIDDFCDTGATLNGVYKFLKEKGAQDIRFYTLLAREGYQLDKGVEVDFGILDNTKNFYIGCGLDDNNKCRMVNEIYYYENENEEET